MRSAFYGSLGLVVAVAASYAVLYSRLPSAPSGSARSAARMEWPSADAPPAGSWAVFRGAGGEPGPTTAGPLARRFRLAGTFFVFAGEQGGQESCRAVLDDLEKASQHLLAEGESVDDVRVVRILPDRIVLARLGQEEELWLGFKSAAVASPASQDSEPAGGVPDAGALEVNRFGKRVGESRWLVSREALMGYYKELLDDPERIAALYVSMKPDYKSGKIAGYHVDIEGENDFFKAAGLEQGDIVRKVNSMNMTSQSRAEYFIGEFVKNRLNAVVIDIERDGQPRKLIYMVR